MKTNLKTKFAVAYLVMTIVGQLMATAFMSLAAGCASHQEWAGWLVAAVLTMGIMLWWRRAVDNIGRDAGWDENDE